MTDDPRGKAIWIGILAIIFIAMFCVGFVYFYTNRQQDSASDSRGGLNKPLPPAELIDESNQVLADTELRNGKVILVFVTPDCDACLIESEFLQKVLKRRSDVPFYGVVSFGDKEAVLREAKEKFPFKVFYDQHFRLAGGLGVKRVPIKVFVNNGVVKKIWGGATVREEKQDEFLSWLESL